MRTRGTLARPKSLFAMFIVKIISARSLVLGLLASAVVASISQAQTASEVPVFEITPASSTIQFDVEASVAIKGTFNKWDATLNLHVSRCHDRCSGHQDSGGQRGYWKRHDNRGEKLVNVPQSPYFLNDCWATVVAY